MNGEHEGPRSEPGIGRRLREAREERGLTLGQVEERTKIRARYLGDLERENFGVLPVVYVIGSLKTYADHLGLDGEALSADLRRRLEPEEPETLLQEPAKAGGERDTEDEYEAVPLLTVGFDHLFLGMGLVLIFSLAAMTLVFALATNDGPAVSQIREPALPETPSEIALAGNFLERPERQPRNQVAPPAPPEPENAKDDGRNTKKNEDSPGRQPDPPEQQPEDASSQDSLFDDVKFVPPPTFSPPATGTASPAASASPLSTASAPSSPVPVSPVPASPAPASSASASSASASPAPVDPPASATANPRANPEPATDTAVDTPPPTATVPAAPPEAAGTGSAPAATAGPGPSAAAGAPGLQGSQPGGLDASSLVDGIDARVDAAVDPLR